MTGEVSLRGKVLIVGGLREKALAAYRAGVKTMLFPAVNVKDLDEVPEDVRAQLEMVPVETMDEVFAVALHRVIVPQRVAGDFVIEVGEDDMPTGEEETPMLKRAARSGRRG
jgi:ATP-dependent Lon protease